MARKSGPSDDDYNEAARLGLLGLSADEDSDVGAARPRSVHRWKNVRRSYW